ncbi:VOC family protein [Novosphingobium bradum]|uniref:VOC family protein n=1 Tax=Novosphingobium bradum TaxID=1737444 RepID=A0ABV7IUW9_9SPHN
MLLANHFQNAYVTADIDAAVAAMVEQFALTRAPRQIDARQMFTTPDGTAEGTMRMAFIQVGHLQYELIQPVSGNVRLYADFVVPDRPLTLHHVAMRTDDIEAVRAESEAHGRPVVLEGAAQQGLRFMYVDARRTLGHYLEYVQAPEEFWGAKKA